MNAQPVIRLLPKHDARTKSGHPWIYSNEIAMDAAAKALPHGSAVSVVAADGQRLGTAFFNAHTLIAGRMLTADPSAAVDRAFFKTRFAAALALRDRLYDAPYYRLAHAEADGLPAIVVDRMGDVLSVQLNAAGPDRYADDIVGALAELLSPRAIVLKNDSPVRALEGLDAETRLAYGTLEAGVELLENGARFRVDPLEGQKTGWFYDQRDNRAFIARLAKGKRVLDAYCYAGGFGIECAVAGAASVVMIDRSAAALEAAAAAARLNGVDASCTRRQEEIFEALSLHRDRADRFDIVVVDPPAFAKSRKDVGGALRAYRKLARLAASLVAPGGILFAASCSYNVTVEDFGESVARGLGDARRTGRILRQAGAGPDHPVHPMLPESAYLKSLTLALD
jgi:23S rRNA (cytosine1962-C5)-methyltransferase